MLLNSTLSAEILATPNPAKIKIPAIPPFSGTQCSEEHMIAYKKPYGAVYYRPDTFMQVLPYYVKWPSPNMVHFPSKQKHQWLCRARS